MNNNIKYFFNNIDNSIYNNPKELAKNYLSYLVDTRQESLKISNNSVFITRDDNNLSYITKRCFLISDGLSLSCKSKKSVRFDVDYSTIDNGYATGYYSFNNNLYKLGKWIQQSRSLLIDGKLSYFPNTYAYIYDVDSLCNNIYAGDVETLTDFTNVADAIISTHKITTISSNKSNKYLKPILTLEIPIIDSVDLENFCNISLENTDALCSFQAYLKQCLLSINTDSPNELEKLSHELNLQLNDIRLKYKNIINKYHMNALISSIVTVVAILFIVSPDISELVRTAIGIGSCYGLVPFLESNISYFLEKDTLQENRCYFLWVLQQ